MKEGHVKEGGRARRGERKNGRVGEREADDFVINQKIDGSCFKRIKSVSNQKKKERKKGEKGEGEKRRRRRRREENAMIKERYRGGNVCETLPDVEENTYLCIECTIELRENRRNQTRLGQT